MRRFKERFGDMPVRSLELRHADKYIGWRRREEVKDLTINRELACLRHMVEWAVDRGYADRNPFRRLQMLEEQQYAPLRATDEIIDAVFGQLEPHVLPVFVLIRETGARRGEVLRLEHWQVDRENREILFAKRTKSGKNRLVPITDRALEALAAVPPLPGCPYVFYNPETGTRWSDARKPWLEARKAAGYPWLRVRDLRPAFGIEASEMGVPMHFIQSVLGHSSVAVTEKYYAKFRPDAAAKAVLTTVESARKGQNLAQNLAQQG